MRDRQTPERSPTRSLLLLPDEGNGRWADANIDNQITARELHTYVRENVVQHSGGSQVPELQGNAERVLVRFR